MGAQRLKTGAAIVVGLLLSACSGPRPEVRVSGLEPPALAGQPYKVHLVVHNKSGGPGQVEVQVRMTDKTTGDIYKDSERVELDEDERVSVLVRVHAPPSEHYQVTAEARYPIE